MKLIGLSGPHGIGKTTIVRNIPPFDMPTATFYDFDVVNITNGYEAQAKRIELFTAVLNAVEMLSHSDFLVILDRTPYDYIPYIRATVDNVLQREELLAKINNLIRTYEMFAPLTVVMVEPEDYVELNIRSRNRSIDDEIELLRKVYDKFYRPDFIGGNFIRVRSSDFLKNIERFIFSNI